MCHQMFHRRRHHRPSSLLTDGEPLKIKILCAEELSVHADLFAQQGGFTPRPAWQVIEVARRQMLTGELSLATTPNTRVYLRDGQVYFAERTTDGGLGVRLLVEGVITRQQMGKGALLVSGVEHLGRMFQRDPSIDRQPVELCVELMTDDVLTSVANDMVDHYTMSMYKRHPNGIDRWLPDRIEVITHIVEGSHLAEHDAVITAGPGGRRRSTPTEPAAAAEPAVEEVVEEVVEDVVAAAPPVTEELAVVGADRVDDISTALALAATFSQRLEPISMAAIPSFSLSNSIGNSLAAAAAAGLLDPCAPLTPETLFAENPAEAGSHDASGTSLAQSAVDAIMSSAIADEVAEAVRRALAAIDAAAQPVPTISPADFADPAAPAQHNATASAA